MTKNSMEVKNFSKCYLKIKNGPEYEWNLPDFLIEDLMMDKSKVKIKGVINIEDKVNKVFSRVVFTEKKFFKMPKIKLNFWSKEEKKVEKKKDQNEFLIKIFKRVMKEKVVFVNGGGNFARYVRFGEEKTENIYWSHQLNNDASKFEYEKKDEDFNMLPTSSVRREELKLVEEKKFKEADDAIDKLEEEFFNDEKKKKENRTKKNAFGFVKF